MNSRRNALGIGVLTVLPLGAVPTLLGQVRQGSVASVMEPGTRFAWALAIVAGSVIALTGIALRDASKGVLVEAVGVATIAMPTAVYGTLALVYIGEAASFAAAAYYGITLACLARATQCVVTLHRAQALDRRLTRRRRR